MQRYTKKNPEKLRDRQYNYYNFDPLGFDFGAQIIPLLLQKSLPFNSNFLELDVNNLES